MFSCNNEPVEKIDNTTYLYNKLNVELLIENHYPIAHNYWFYLKDGASKENKKTLTEKSMVLAAHLRKQGIQIAIKFMDTNNLYHLVGVYPMEKNDYIPFAEHFVSDYNISADGERQNSVWLYPYIDGRYLEYGGKRMKEFDSFEKK